MPQITVHPTLTFLKMLEYYKGPTLPRQTLEAAIANPDRAIPELLTVLEYTASHPDAVLDDPQYMAHMYTLYLLAQFREERAYPLFIKLFSIPGDEVFELTGNIITEDLPRMLAAICGGDIEPIKALAENIQVDEFVRSAALRSLVVLVAQGVKSREEILAYFKAQLHQNTRHKDEFICASLINESNDLYPDLVYAEIKRAFKEKLVDEMVINLKIVNETIKNGLAAAMKTLQADRQNQPITNTIAEMETWSSFRRVETSKLLRRDSGQLVRKGSKIGRNDPCPCGSGLKYKRCCGKASA